MLKFFNIIMNLMNSKIFIVGLIIAIIIGIMFVFIGTDNTGSDLEEIPPEIVESVAENVELQPEGKHITVELSDSLTIVGP